MQDLVSRGLATARRRAEAAFSGRDRTVIGVVTMMERLCNLKEDIPYLVFVERLASSLRFSDQRS